MKLYEELEPWFALKSVPGIGNYLFKRLLDCFHSPQQVFGASADELARVTGITPRLIRNIHRHRMPAASRADLESTLAQGYRVITLNDTDYPEMLHHIEDPPPFLYASGNLSKTPPHIAIVGSRSATRYGLSAAGQLSADLASLGFVVVSGMARGIDTAAHRGALSAGGLTTAVLGSGLECIYPPENRRLSREIAERGAVISEFELQAEPQGHHFPARNRIISGMCLGTVVVEASRKSGSLITARLAAEQNREVFAVPGSIRSFKSTGTHALIKQGAKLVEHVGDIVEEFAGILQSSDGNRNDGRQHSNTDAPQDLSSDERRVCRALGPYAIHIDDLARQIDMEPGNLSAILLTLELKGVVAQEPGSRFLLK